MLFFILRLSGDPVALMLPENATAEQVTELRDSLGLNAPLYLQYVNFVRGALVLDFGESLRFHEPAMGLVLQRLPATIQLTAAAVLVVVVVGVPLGIIAALRRGKLDSQLLLGLTLIGQAMPSFWLGVVLILVFSVQLRLLPTGGYGELRHFVLPAITLSSFFMAKVARMVRSGMLDVMSEDYIRTARAKGLHPTAEIVRHALKNTLIP
ncbi:MAG: ABC transporter permease, partial [Chloroflexi bacterium]|nr:ABC transporter permease [Chloroflexota bacterium]